MKRKEKQLDDLYGDFAARAIDIEVDIEILMTFIQEFKLANEENIRGRVRTLEALESLREDIDVLFKSLREPK